MGITANTSGRPLSQSRLRESWRANIYQRWQLWLSTVDWPNLCRPRRSDDAILFLPLGLALGIAAFFSLRSEPSVSITGLVLGLTACPFLMMSFKQRFLVSSDAPSESRPRVINPLLKNICLFICLIGIGFSAAKLRTDLVKAPVVSEEITYTEVEGIITGLDPMPQPGVVRIMLSDLWVEKLAPPETPRYIRLKVRNGEALRPGYKVRLLAGLNPPARPVTPGAFDFQFYAFFRQIGAVGFTYYPPEIIEYSDRSDANKGHLGVILEQYRFKVAQSIQENMDVPYAGIMTTFLTGDKSAIPAEDLQAMRDSGLAHLLAISGLHVGLIAGVVFFFVRLALAAVPILALRWPIKKIAALCAFFAAFGYMLLVGATIPTQRAMMMTGLVLIAIMLDRSPFSLRLVACAAAVILLIFPESLLSPSFQMSFAAVTALVWSYERMRPLLYEWHQDAGFLGKAGLYLLGIALTTIISSLATAPFSLYHFQHVSLSGQITNLMAVPIMVFWVMPFAVLSYLGIIAGLAWGPLKLMGQGVDLIVQIAHWGASLPLSALSFPAFPTSVLGLGVLAALLWMIQVPVFKSTVYILCALSLCLYVLDRPADAHISERANIALIVERDALYATSLRRDSYFRENIQEMHGGLPIYSLRDHPEAGCDLEGCRLMHKGFRISVAQTPYAQRRDCQWADLLIILQPPAINCEEAKVISRYQTSYQGAQAIRFVNDTLKIETDLAVRGDRPWVR